MRFPELVPNWVCTIPITVVIEGEHVSEDGEPLIGYEETTSTRVTENGETVVTEQTEVHTVTIETYCNWQDGGQAVYTPDQKVIEIKGRAYFNGDLCPDIPNITGGEAYVFGEKREIHQGFKRRNPDGSVNHTEIQFK